MAAIATWVAQIVVSPFLVCPSGPSTTTWSPRSIRPRTSQSARVEPALVQGDLQVAGLVAEGEEAELAHVALEHDPAGGLDDRAAVVAHVRGIGGFDGGQRLQPVVRPP